MIPTIFTNEQELLTSILSIHVPGNKIDLDPMFYKGNFYKSIPKPEHTFDICPQDNLTIQADAKNIPLPDKSIYCIVLDPPFMFGIHGQTKNYYSSATHGIFQNFQELENLYKGILSESYRLLKKKGILIFKCQDFTDSKTTLTHCYVWMWAEQLGYYTKDLAILYLPKNKIYNKNLIQRHMRKVHSYFFVFQK